jgi:hypothetical protein
MLNLHSRRVGSFLLRSAISIAPQHVAEWGQAMLGELHHIEGDWAALVWALGGASVLAKHALLSVFVPKLNRQIVPSSEELFAKEGLMRKAALIAVGSCLLASLLFFLAPAFRQAFQVSLTQWHYVLNLRGTNHDPGLEKLARRAEEKKDPQGLAFVAVRHWDPAESARLADESVALDPKLTWIYAVVAVNHAELSDHDQWIPKLEQWDPGNALPYLITAEGIDIDEVSHGRIAHRIEEQSPAWQTAMAAAFQSPKLDPYLDRLQQLNRQVLLRYGSNDPYQAMCGECWVDGLPSYAAADSFRYAGSLLESGKVLEVRGDRKGARQKYWTVARFDQMMMGSSGGWLERRSLGDVYDRFEALSQKEGNEQQAELYAYLAATLDLEEKADIASLHKRVTGGAVSRWNATVVRASGVAMLSFVALGLICILSPIVRSRSLRFGSIRLSRPIATLGTTSAIGLLFSSAVLYLSYRPYAEIFRTYLRDGDQSRLNDLTDFLVRTQIPLGARGPILEFVFHFWFAVTALCVAGLLLVALRYLLSRRPTVAASN